MPEDEDLLRITDADINEANQLSYACPICAGPVENSPAEAELSPVVCIDCDTLYHRACWEQNGGKCAILGCTSNEVRPYGVAAGMITISVDDVPSELEVNRRNKRLKTVERERLRREGRQPEPTQSRGFWQDLFGNIARAFGFRRSQ